MNKVGFNTNIKIKPLQLGHKLPNPYTDVKAHSWRDSQISYFVIKVQSLDFT